MCGYVKKPNAVFDLTKYILSIMVIAIHSNIFPMILYPWLRLAVPLFFMVSSYFLFKKLQKAETSSKDGAVWHYIKRNMILYLFWFVVLLPISVYLHYDIWIEERNILCLLRFIRSIVFASTFPASWYISATILATLIVYLLSKKMNNVCLLVIGSICYVFACLVSSYSYVVDSIRILDDLVNAVKIVVPVPYNSFLVGIFWIVCGKCIAESKLQIKMKYVISIAVVSAIMLELEFRFHVKMTDVTNSDLYFMLIPVAICVFILICRIPRWENMQGETMRKFSTLYYVMHLAVLDVINYFFVNVLHYENSVLFFLLTLLIVTVASSIILILEKKKHFKWLKYSH